MGNDGGVFWTFCPYCFYVYSYDKVYEGCCLRCQNVGCRRAFHGVCLGNLPRMELDKGEYFGCFGYFPLGFSPFEGDSKAKFENWSPLVGLFPVERMEKTYTGRVGNDGDDDDVEVLDDGDELGHDVYGHESGEKQNMMTRRKMVARSAKKLRTRRRRSNDGGGGNVAGQGLDFDGGVSGFQTESDVAGGSGYGCDSENMNFEEDGEIFTRFRSDDTAF